MGVENVELRPIGLLERFHTTRHFLGFDSCVVASAKYSTPDQQPLRKEILFPALHQVIKAQPPLCVKLNNETSSDACFMRLRTIDLSRVVEFQDQNIELQTALEDQLARGFDIGADLPLWRILVLPDNNVVFAVYHGIGDGLSSTAFHLALLRGLQSITVHDASPLVQIPDTVALAPPIDALTSLRPSLRTIAGELFKFVAPRRWTRAAYAWSGKPVPRTTSLRTHVRLLRIPPNEVTAFQATCRAHGATLTSAFYVLAVTAISRLLPAARYRTIASAVPISLRELAGVPRDAIYDCVCVHYAYPPINSEFSWIAAARYAATLRVQKREAGGTLGMLRILRGNYVPFFREHRKHRATGFALSNLGRFDVPAAAADSPWSIVDTVFAQCDVVIGAAFKMNVVGDPLGAVNITFTWGENSIEGLFLESFITQFQDGFRALLP